MHPQPRVELKPQELEVSSITNIVVYIANNSDYYIEQRKHCHRYPDSHISVLKQIHTEKR